MTTPPRTYEVITYGCQMNVHDSERISGLLEDAGYLRADAESQTIAREIARQIEAELTYPGQIRITVVRESRAIELAH